MNLSKVMGVVTAALYATLIGYVVAWYRGKVQGDFSLLLFILTAVTFMFLLFDRLYLKPQRVKKAKELEQQIRQLHAGVAEEQIHSKIAQAQASAMCGPWWIEWTAGFFWVILIVFMLRSFVVEPFRIPSGSMMPTLETGDFILVNKYDYGLRLPVINTKLTQGTPPQRGDVVVFRLPHDESITYIKRIVGLPGDEVVYQNRQLIINGQVISQERTEDYLMIEDAFSALAPSYSELLGSIRHRILRDTRPVYIEGSFYFRKNFPCFDHCRYFGVGNFSCKVPAGHYYVMGDNRDNSVDSRFWGFVPEENIVGKAFFIWMNFGQLNRIGGFQ